MNGLNQTLRSAASPSKAEEKAAGTPAAGSEVELLEKTAQGRRIKKSACYLDLLQGGYPAMHPPWVSEALPMDGLSAVETQHGDRRHRTHASLYLSRCLGTRTT
jgi:hypothetical protein